MSAPKENNLVEIGETKGPQMIPHARKLAGLHDLKLLSKAPDVKKFSSPADEIVSRGVKVRIADFKIKKDTAANMDE